jgi:hypothetical protein
VSRAEEGRGSGRESSLCTVVGSGGSIMDHHPLFGVTSLANVLPLASISPRTVTLTPVSLPDTSGRHPLGIGKLIFCVSCRIPAPSKLVPRAASGPVNAVHVVVLRDEDSDAEHTAERITDFLRSRLEVR